MLFIGTGKEVGDRHPKVNDNVLIGASATILGNISIGKGAQVAAGSLVLKNVPPRTMVAGSPAKEVGKVTGELHLSLRCSIASSQILCLMTKCCPSATSVVLNAAGAATVYQLDCLQLDCVWQKLPATVIQADGQTHWVDLGDQTQFTVCGASGYRSFCKHVVQVVCKATIELQGQRLVTTQQALCRCILGYTVAGQGACHSPCCCCMQVSDRASQLLHLPLYQLCWYILGSMPGATGC